MLHQIIPPSLLSGGVRNSFLDLGKNYWLSFFLSVVSFSSHTFKGNKAYMNASKITNQIFDILTRSRDI